MNMKEDRSMLLVLSIIFILVIVMVVIHYDGYQYREDLTGEIRTVVWEFVNGREEPSIYSNILKELQAGTRVRLTGNTWKSLSGEDTPTNYWIEVQVFLADGKPVYRLEDIIFKNGDPFLEGQKLDTLIVWTVRMSYYW